MDLTTPESLEFVVRAYMVAASEREDLELLHLLSTSPDSIPSDEYSDDDLPPLGRGGSDERRSSWETDVQARSGGQDAPPPKDRKVVFASDPEAGFRFTREEVPATADGVTGASELSALIKGGSGDGGGTGKQMQIRVFGHPIPGDPMDVLVPEAATMAKVVSLVLQQYMRAHSCEALRLDCNDFELLMAEDDGRPDEDLPRLNRTQVIGEFGHSDFVLLRHSEVQHPAHAAQEQGSQGQGSAPPQSAAAGAKSTLLRVQLPPEAHGQRLQGHSILVEAPAEMQLSELMQLVCRKPTVQLDPAKHAFRRDADTKQELDAACKCAAVELDSDSRGQRTIVVAAKVFADAPRQQRVQPGSRSLDHGSQDGATEETDFIFSDVTAARYKEYIVVKVNKRGVRQERVLGIDRERFYNIARAAAIPEEGGSKPSALREWGLKTVGLRSASGGTKHPFHLVRDIVYVSLGQERPCSFVCVFKDPLEVNRRKEYHYEAASNHEAAEIVAKINYLTQLHAKGVSFKGTTSHLPRDALQRKRLGSSRV